MKWSSRYITLLASFIALTIAGTMLGLPQLFTGPFVNAMLLLTAMVLDAFSAVLLCCITPLVAVVRGQLPPALAPMIPFIMLGNTLFVLVFCRMQRLIHARTIKSSILRDGVSLCCAAAVKFLTLTASAGILLPVLFGVTLPRHIISIMMFPQFFTAVAGGIFALVLFTLLTNLGILPMKG